MSNLLFNFFELLYFKKILKETGGSDSVLLPSIVVCPPTLIGHWTHEVQKFIPKNILRPLQYSGLPVERQK